MPGLDIMQKWAFWWFVGPGLLGIALGLAATWLDQVIAVQTLAAAVAAGFVTADADTNSHPTLTVSDPAGRVSTAPDADVVLAPVGQWHAASAHGRSDDTEE